MSATARSHRQVPIPKGWKLWLGRLYLGYAGLLFLLSFLVLFPFFALCIHIRPIRHWAAGIDWVWCRFFWPLCGIPVRVTRQFRPLAGERYVYVANHTSYLDIPLLTYILPGFVCFMGKDSLAKIPLFGYMFRNNHITVNRRSRQDSRRAYEASLAALDEGRSLVIFPEGGILTKHLDPKLHPFKDGAFRMALEKQVKIVPITIGDNWLILPDDKSLMARWRPLRVTVHPPIETAGLGLEAATCLLQQAWHTIDAQFRAYNPEYVIPASQPLAPESLKPDTPA